MNNKNVSSTDLIINDLSNKNNRLTDKIHELENKLQQIKEQNFDFFEISPVNYIIINSERRIHNINLNACKNLKISRTSAINHKITNYIHKDDISKFNEIIDIISNNLIISKIQIRLLSSDKRIINCILQGKTTTNTEHNLIYLSFTDISELKSEQDEKLKNKELLEKLITASPDSIIMFDKEGIISFVSSKTLLLFKEKNENDVIGKKIYNWIIPEQHQIVKNNINSIFDGKDSIKTNYTFIKKDKSCFYGGVNATTLKDNTGEISGFIATIRDISENVQINQNLIHMRSILQATIESTNIAINVIKPNRELITYNKKFIELWNLPEDFELKFTDHERFNHLCEQVRDKEFFINSSENLLKNLDRDSFNIIYLNDGRIFGRTALPFKIENKTIGKLFTYEDITEKINAENTLRSYSDELKELNATKDKFFSIIAHDLKNPFNGILGFSNLLEEDYNQLEDEERKLFITQIKNSAVTAYKLLENLLEWSRAQTGSLSWKPEFYDISNIVNETILLLKENANAKNIRLVSKVPFNTLIFADINMVKTVLRNFIQNSIKFTNKGGEIKILSSEEENYIRIAVKDNGIGISDDIYKKLFKIDQKIISEGTEKEKGTGLGLILCKEFVERNGGKINIRSKVNSGTEISFTLPKSN